MPPEDLASLLESTMRNLNGLGLSACQIGYNVRVFSMRTEPDVTIFNPRVVDVSNEVVELEEGCLSFPNLIVKVKRPRLIRARFQLMDGEVRTMKFDGMTARIFQHELDHLNGRLFFDQVSNLKLGMAIRKAAKTGKKYTLGQLRS